MTSSCTCRRLLAALLLGALGATATAGELRPLSEDELSAAYGRGLSPATLVALTSGEQGDRIAAASEADALSALDSMSADGVRGLDRQLSLQQARAATTGLQATVRTAQALATLAQLLTPAATVLASASFPPLLPLPALPGLAAIDGKH